MSSKPIYCSCTLCKKVISTNNISKHYNSKSCISEKTQQKKLTNCKYCGLSFDGLATSQRANHSRWCIENPRSEIDREQISNFARQGNLRNSKESREKARIGIIKAHADGKYEGSSKKAAETSLARGTRATKESNPTWFNNVCAGNRNSGHQRVCKRTHKYTDKRGRTFNFDSSWEDALASRLDELDIYWIRPGYITYIIDGVERKYFPDFYLPEYDLYIDPKNTYVITQQQEKLQIVSKIINLLIIDNLDDCKNFSI